MAGYDQFLSELGGSEGGSELKALVNAILRGAGFETRATGAGGSGLLRNALGGLTGSMAAGSETGPSSAASSTVATVFRALGASSPLSSLDVPVSRAIGGGDSVPLPLRGIAGLLGGLFGLLHRDSGAVGSSGITATPYEFPSARNPSLAVGGGQRAGAEFDNRFDGQPRRVQQEWQGGGRVEIHIQALDARSLLDRKEELAEAVRQAMSTSGTSRETFLGY